MRNGKSSVATEFTHTIDGRAENSKVFFAVINPATGSPFAHCPDASRLQLDAAVAAARRAFRSWSLLSFDERRGYLLRFAQILRQRAEELIPLLVQEQGKPLAAARKEVIGAPAQIEQVCSLEIKTEVLRDDPQCRIELRYRSLGRGRYYRSVEFSGRDRDRPSQSSPLHGQHGSSQAF